METAPGIENSSTTPCPSLLRQTLSSPGLVIGMVLATVWMLFFLYEMVTFFEGAV